MKPEREYRKKKRDSEPLRRMLAAGRTYMLLSVGSALFFVAFGLALMARGWIVESPAASMKGFAGSVSDALFSDMLGMELAAFRGGKSSGALSAPQTAAFVVRLLTDVNPGDPRSLLAGEVPSLRDDGTVLLQSGTGTDIAAAPQDDRPLETGDGGAGRKAGGAGDAEGGSGGASGSGTAGAGAEGGGPAGEADASGSGDSAGGKAGGEAGGTAGSKDGGSGGGQAADGEGAGGGAGSKTGDAGQVGSGDSSGKDGKAGDDGAQPTTGSRRVVFIYHSHNRESWKPELGGDSADPTSKTVNVTLVGKRLAQQLEKRGIGAQQSTTDYPTAVRDYRWELSYKYSSETLKQAMAGNRDLTYFFDIHRDSQTRKYTTATIGGKDYAQVYFIIGHRNPNWRENEAFATRIHKAMEAKYPGISRGVWGKTAANGNGEYNQHVSPDSVLIEIGGIDNTLQECYRTADALAGVIADIYWNAEKVNAGKAS